ncbi:MAG: hypothetical protein U9O56_09790 [Campylobacterota bacterium]|nr:hypothetical protein [Campylobacterota bacterium]
MYKNLSTKNQTLLFVSVVMIIFSTVLISVIYLNQKIKLEKLEYNYYEDIKNSYEKILEKQTVFYQNRIKANIY